MYFMYDQNDLLLNRPQVPGRRFDIFYRPGVGEWDLFLHCFFQHTIVLADVLKVLHLVLVYSQVLVGLPVEGRAASTTGVVLHGGIGHVGRGVGGTLPAGTTAT